LGASEENGGAHNERGERRAWLRRQMEFLGGIFAIDVVAHAVQENHLHIICRTRPDLRDALSDEEVVKRWKKLYPGKRELDGEPVEPDPSTVAALAANPERVHELRKRLGSISWYMKALKEPLARKANRDDSCTGHFWEGRFKCQPLLDLAAALACMVYVDLNPIRAQAASTPEEATFTSAHDRIHARQARKKLAALEAQARAACNEEKPTPEQARRITQERGRVTLDTWLTPIEQPPHLEPGARRGILPMSLDAYLELLDWTGRQLRAGKPGAIPDHLAPILKRLDIDCQNWLETIANFGSWFHRVAGKLESLTQAARRLGRRWFQGKQQSAQAFTSPLR